MINIINSFLLLILNLIQKPNIKIFLPLFRKQSNILLDHFYKKYTNSSLRFF
jgi:hypothetical protein